MEVLYWFESIRTSIGDSFFSLITHLGDETAFVVIAMIVFWCVNKTEGFYILSVGLLGTTLNQFLKLFFRIPRPWVKDENFTIVESAREKATGYSFPSGHTPSAVGLFGSVARARRNTVLRIICISICILVPISRMYLGVHTLLDVSVSAVISLILIFGIYPLVRKSSENPSLMRMLWAGITVVALLNILFVEFYNFPTNVDAVNLAGGTKNAYTMVGVITGIWLSFEVDLKFIKFETKALWWVQIIKVIVGFAIFVGIKTLLKTPLYMVMGENYFADFVRYFIMTVFAGIIWPMTFKFFSSIGKKDRA